MAMLLHPGSEETAPRSNRRMPPAQSQAWDDAMAKATEYCLIARAYAGMAVIATPEAQIRAGVRDSVLQAHQRIEPEAACLEAFARFVEFAEKAGYRIPPDREAFRITLRGGDGWEAEKAAIDEARRHHLICGRHLTEGDTAEVWTIATPAAQRTGTAHDTARKDEPYEPPSGVSEDPGPGGP